LSDFQRPAQVMFYVQHLLGTGHLQRAAAIARASASAGLETVLVSGGIAVPGLDLGRARFIQLPPLRARDESFSELVDRDGTLLDEPFKAARHATLLRLFDALRPQVLMTEMFPFGRRQMRFELLPLIEHARSMQPRPRILCSLRDVLTTHKQPGKTDWMLTTFAQLYDLALVHGDPDILPLERSLPRVCEVADRLRYTGYVLGAPAPPARSSARDGGVIVSTGGGAVAGPLVSAALEARSLSPLADVPWHILVGANFPEAAFQDAVFRAPQGVVVERARPDFRSLLGRARLSISQGGYNTVMDVLAARIPAVVVPFSTRNETEQALRARVFADRGLLRTVDDEPLTAESLAGGVRAALALPSRGLDGIRAGGAEETARILTAMCGGDERS